MYINYDLESLTIRNREFYARRKMI